MLDFFGIFLSKGMGTEIPENSVECKSHCFLGGTSFRQTPWVSLEVLFALWIDQFTNEPGLTFCWVLLNNTLVLFMDQYVSALLNKQVTSPKIGVPLANS